MMVQQALTAGKELDVLVAKKVLGWTLVHREKHSRYEWQTAEGNLLPYWQVPDFSTDIAAAWRLVEVLEEKADESGLRIYSPKALDESVGGSEAGWGIGFELSLPGGGRDVWVRAHTFPLALCLAALEAS